MDAIKNGQPVPWTAIRIIDSIDKKELGSAISASGYSIMMASQFLDKYKLSSWKTHKSNKAAVTDQERREVSEKIAKDLASHDKWKNHGHAIHRDDLWDKTRLQIEHPKSVPNLERAIIRFWALCQRSLYDHH